MITAASTTPEVIDATAIRTSWFTTPQASRGTSYTTSRDFMADTNRSGSGPFGGSHSEGLLPPLRSAGSVKEPVRAVHALQGSLASVCSDMAAHAWIC